MIDNLRIGSPKRIKHLQNSWEGFFPYYAGFSEDFALSLLGSANLPKGSLVLDPWNGSGTTTYAASKLGLSSRGFDLNPVMVIVGRARLLAGSEADSIEPIASSLLKKLEPTKCKDADPLLNWFAPKAAAVVRAIERRICRRLVGKLTITTEGTKFDKISGTAATFYVALFSVCRQLVSEYQSTNPTWLRRPRGDEEKISTSQNLIVEMFSTNLSSMAAALAAKVEQGDFLKREDGRWDIGLADSTSRTLDPSSIDFVLTSPPYCTRIDYTAATRIELAVLYPLLQFSEKDLGRAMIGSTRVPKIEIKPSPAWGKTCNQFLKRVSKHPSKASAGYYLKTHLDYFDKLARSISNLSTGLKPSAVAVFVVQDSYYKDVHNDLPEIVSEMCKTDDLILARREDFPLVRSMSGINPRSRVYDRAPGATETVLCFRKS